MLDAIWEAVAKAIITLISKTVGFAGGASGSNIKSTPQIATLNTIVEFTDADGAILQTIWDYLLPLSFVLVAIYFCCGLMEEYMRMGRQMDMAALIKALSAIVITDIIMMMGYHFVGTILSLSNVFSVEFDTVMSNAASNATSAGTDEVLNIILGSEGQKAVVACLAASGAGILEGLLLLVFSAFLGTIISGLSTVVIVFTAITIKIKILGRLAYAPIGLAGLASESHRHEALKYVRKMLACSLYVAAAICAIHMVNLIPGTMALKMINDMFTVNNGTLEMSAPNILTFGLKTMELILISLVSPLCVLGSITAFEGIINEALGA